MPAELLLSQILTELRAIRLALGFALHPVGAASIDEDRKRIARLGGPTRVADLLAFKRPGGVQRVQNWLTRGIPPAVKVQRPELFLVPVEALPAPAAAAPQSNPQETGHAT